MNRNLNINLNPKKAQPLTSIRSFNLDLESTISGRKIFRRIGYMENFRNSNEPCLFIHGSPQGTTGFHEGIIKTSFFGKTQSSGNMQLFTIPELVDFLNERHRINLKGSNKNLHLICCYASLKGGVGDQLANYIGRTIVTYGDNVVHADDMHTFMRHPNTKIYGKSLFSQAKPKKHFPEKELSYLEIMRRNGSRS